MLLKKLQDNKVDYLFVFGIQILRGDILNIYKDKIINFHPSLLPMFPGLNAIDQAVKFGMKVLGNTAHFIDETVDGGKIILQNIVSIEIYNKYGCDGILNSQVDLFFRLYRLFNNNKIHICNEKVIIENANYEVSIVLPNIN